jgi:hypothetical protein
VLLIFWTGCSRSTQIKSIDQVCLPDIKKQQAMKVAEDVLTGMHFKMAKADEDAGVVKTRPLTAAQFFEFWRKDNVGGFNTSEANLHTIRRIVQVNINSQANQVCIDCDVKTQKLSLAEKKTHSRLRPYSLFSKSGAKLQKLKLDNKEKAWIDLGSDTRLSSAILGRIQNKLKNQQGKKVQ